MSDNLCATTVPLFKQMLSALLAVLAKAQAQAEARKIEPAALLQARLFPAMFLLLRQARVAGDLAKSVAGRLAGVDQPVFEDNEQSFDDLQAHIAKTLACLDGLTPAQFDSSATREIVTQAGRPKEKRFAGQSYLLNYGLLHFFFPVTTA